MKKDYLLKRVFKFDGVTSLRTLVIEWPVYDKLGEALHDAFGKPVTRRDVGFVGKDAADILEYRNASHAILRHVAPGDRTKRTVVDGAGRSQHMWIINEPGLYGLIFGSQMEDARRLGDFVKRVVLPSIQRYGAYMEPEVLARAETDDAARKTLFEALSSEKAHSRALLDELTEARPKIEFYDTIGGAENASSMGDTAKMLANAGFLNEDNDCPLGRNNLYRLLRRWGYLCSQPSSFNTPYAWCMEKGWFKVKEKRRILGGASVLETMVLVTGRGQAELLRLFHEKASLGEVAVHPCCYQAPGQVEQG
ncbi:phage antirepressor KilAC domain-containing protein [Eubacterium sp. 1001713B170207_170306_E7]|uniref:phage antirepressor KilAC domain-containing protein n=1 Tax=Eubacterium sp. 1001713B170207_170306_E7 TaxID=2787097 RepID=UPI001899AE02|nr:phage antirepressor KilAC domain-containing protein [Eubacterium sp. 1001713B170207_170306_E7]